MRAGVRGARGWRSGMEGFDGLLSFEHSKPEPAGSAPWRRSLRATGAEPTPGPPHPGSHVYLTSEAIGAPFPGVQLGGVASTPKECQTARHPLSVRSCDSRESRGEGDGEVPERHGGLRWPALIRALEARTRRERALVAKPARDRSGGTSPASSPRQPSREKPCARPGAEALRRRPSGKR